MTLLEEVTKVAAERVRPQSQDECPVFFRNRKFSFVNLKLKAENPNSASLLFPLPDWKVSETDAALTSTIRTFSDKLKLKLKDGKRFCKNDFIQILTNFLENVVEIVGVSAGMAPKS